ncbi:MAG: TGS domain-containing protein [Desulfurococcaceae archaeon]|jgi:ribosome-interacting GTPase 1|nr:TGS domain-containing protein [Desulfurococcaceae archaeon]
MPANLPAEAKAKLAKYSEARTIEEKIRALEEFISSVPKHKGTENIMLWARRRLAELREELELRKRKRVGGGGLQFFVEKAGVAQVVILGPPNVGKSSILAKLTNAKPEISPYPYTTKTPVPGMLVYEDVQIQLVDTPPLNLVDIDSSLNNRVLGLARNADAIILVFSVDCGELEEVVKRSLSLLEDRGIVVTRLKGVVRIKKSRGVEGVKVVGSGRLLGFTEDELAKLLASYRIFNAIVEVEGDVTLDDVESAIITSKVYKPTIVLVNKIDLAEEPGELVEKVSHLIPADVPVIPVSAEKSLGLKVLGDILFKKLDLIRVYTKSPNKEPDPNPLVVKRGTTVIEVAEMVHVRLAKGFKYAKIWGRSVKYPGQRVGAEHILEDGDVVEIHAS